MMRRFFPGFYRYDIPTIKSAWQNGTFVVDTNVLLNLYRLPKGATDDLIVALEAVKGRLFLPHQVALEFQRNRISVLTDQLRKFAEVRKAVSKQQATFSNELRELNLTRRHSVISVDSLLKQIDSAANDYLKELDERERSQAGISADDIIRDQIHELFPDNAIGPAPSDQAHLEEIYKSGKKRYEAQVPPGYEDEADKKGTFSYGGLFYIEKFGDLIMWEQIIAHAVSEKIKDLILVTDDSKDDWWWTTHYNGKKILGPRPELVEEMLRRAGVEVFLLYSSERFLEFAKEELGTPLNPESLDQVRQVSNQNLQRYRRFLGRDAVKLVSLWLSEAMPGSSFQVNEGFPDIIRTAASGERTGYEVQYIWDQNEARIRTSPESLQKAYRKSTEKGLHVEMVFIAASQALAHRITELLYGSEHLVLRCTIGFVREQGGKRSFDPVFGV